MLQAGISNIVLVRLKWADVIKEYPWINSTQGESYVTTHLVKHPEKIDQSLTHNELVGIEVVLPVNQNAPQNKGVEVIRIDLVYLRDDHYFVIEAKQAVVGAQQQKAEEQVIRNTGILREHLEKNSIPYKEVTPVLAWIEDYPPDSYGKDARYGYMRGQVLTD